MSIDDKTEAERSNQALALLPIWSLSLALKAVLMFIAGPLLFALVLLAAVTTYPESRELLRRHLSMTSVLAGFVAYYLLFISYMAAKLRHRTNLLKSLGLRAFPVWTTIKYLVAYPFVYFAIVIIVVGLIVLTARLLGFSVAPDQLAPNNDKGAFNWTIFVLFSFAIPIIEELLFRGILLPAFVRRNGWLKGSIYSSLIFSGLHGPAAPFIMILSLYLSRMYYRTNSIIPGIILHIANNSVVSIALLL